MNKGLIILFVVVFIVLIIALIKEKRKKDSTSSTLFYLKRNGFNIDKVVTSIDNKNAIYVDTKNKLWCYYNWLDKNIKISPYKDLLDFEIIENGESVIQGRTGSSLLGGAVLGVAGAIAGASGSKRISSQCTELSIKIAINDTSKPYIFSHY